MCVLASSTPDALALAEKLDYISLHQCLQGLVEYGLLYCSHCGVLLILQAEEADDLEVTTDAVTEDIAESAQVVPYYAIVAVTICCPGSCSCTQTCFSAIAVVQETAAVTDNQEHDGGNEGEEDEDVDVELQMLAEVSSTLFNGAW